MFIVILLTQMHCVIDLLTAYLLTWDKPWKEDEESQGNGAAKQGFEVKLMVEEEINLDTV